MNKVLLVVLVLIVVLFVVLVVVGSGTNNTNKFDINSYPALSALGNLFGPPGPKLKASELSPDPPPLRRVRGPAPSPGKFILSAGDQPLNFDISPDSKDQIRRATFAVSRQGCATIDYSTQGKGPAQPWPGPGRKNLDQKNPTRVTFQIGSAGGRMTFSLESNCTVQLE